MKRILLAILCSVLVASQAFADNILFEQPNGTFVGVAATCTSATPAICTLNTLTAPSANTAVALTPTTTAALASNKVIKDSAGNLYSFQVSADSTLSAAPWWIMVFDATALPSNGAVTPLKCYALASGTNSFAAAFPTPIAMANGITIGVSTNGCFTLAASARAFISGDAK